LHEQSEAKFAQMHKHTEAKFAQLLEQQDKMHEQQAKMRLQQAKDVLSIVERLGAVVPSAPLTSRTVVPWRLGAVVPSTLF